MPRGPEPPGVPEDPSARVIPRRSVRALCARLRNEGKRIVFTAPPCARTTSDPTISFLFQSPPLTRTCGTTSPINRAGVSSGKIVT